MLPIGLDPSGALLPGADAEASTHNGGLSPTAKWLVGAALLVALNVGLVGANLHRFELPPFSRSGETSQTAAPVTSAEPVASSRQHAVIPAPESALVGPVEAPSAPAPVEAPTVAPAPEPRKLMAVLSSQGRLMVAGDVPTEALAAALVARASAVLPDGDDAVIADIAVHPEAAAEVAALPVLLWEPAIFAPSSSTLSPDFTPVLDLAVALVADSPHLKLEVEGHASPDGAITPNLFLSAERVASVIAYLTAAGVGEDQIVTAAFGESVPAAQGSDSGTALSDPSRRVEVFIVNMFEER